jgi:hypothetical protein
VYDARVIEQRLAGSSGPDAGVLAAALAQQRWHVRLIPAYAIVNVLPLALVLWLPEVFVARGGHLALVVIQTLIAAGALASTIRAFYGWTGSILRRATVELDTEDR